MGFAPLRIAKGALISRKEEKKLWVGEAATRRKCVKEEWSAVMRCRCDGEIDEF